MQKLNLLFTKDGLQYQICKGKTVQKEIFYFPDENSHADFISTKLDEILSKEDFQQIQVISALNHFSLQKDSFTNHENGLDLIAFNADVDKENEGLMLSINKKFEVQFYYSFPNEYYNKIKSLNLPTNFNFSGENFLQKINVKNHKEIHINLYHHQCEFLALDANKLVLYNNLDINSEVDFLYFVMFTLSKINFGLKETKFFVYGETTENETFISELKKFVNNLDIVFDNIHQQNFILS
ncbi:DUF3822 family protein [Frigoriflavimonas asaccharolytica]|uniref:DUF3822 family protein n=1 Tax=Frigoriflavimonas asaccharolytica TaxID=2735899 RepID=A0A8J8G5C5_9FLAO|nr:DUF3822 family protein [Frigoriflavimonas asaccharolytica]NRS91356.1 hypothetical protein [Frigoriflavimonas asaccharolytica]